MKRNWLGQREMLLCQWGVFRHRSAFGDLLWEREESRLLSENFPHSIQCILILAMAVERYILVCHPVRSTALLSGKRRKCFYVTVTFIIVSLGALFLVAYRAGLMFSDSERYEKNGLHDILNVRGHEIDGFDNGVSYALWLKNAYTFQILF